MMHLKPVHNRFAWAPKNWFSIAFFHSYESNELEQSNYRTPSVSNYKSF